MIKIFDADDKLIRESAERKSGNRNRAVKVSKVNSETAYVTMNNGTVIAVHSEDLLINKDKGKLRKQWWEYQE